MSGIEDMADFENQADYRRVGTPVEIAQVIDPEINSLLMRFQSVGNNCELGLVQRRYGAEPLGLLRWATTLPDMLIKMLDEDFSAIGSRETSRLEILSWGEIAFRDLRYNLHMHTFIHKDGVNLDDFLLKHSKRLAFMGRIMRETLKQNEKIFVYKSNEILPEHIMKDMFSSIRRCGTTKFLCVLPACGPKWNKLVETQEPGLFVGYLENLGPGENGWDIPFEDWISVCRTVAQMVDGNESA